MAGTKSYTADELARIIATPAALGKHIGKDFMGQEYKAYPWILYMEQRILAMLYRPGNEIMIISVPPQQGKSTYCSMLLPAWYIGMHPGHQVINISYNETQAGKWGLRVRNLLRQYGPSLFGVTISPDSDSMYDWKLGNGFGGMMSAGLRGGITGNPGHLIIADDTLKNADEANSPTIKKKNLEEWDDSVTSRFQENTKILVVATRWAEDDLSGELLARSREPGYQGYPVTELNLKAIAEPDPEQMRTMTDEEKEAWRDVLGRRIGEGLRGQHSQRFFEMKRASTPHPRWMALHQGTPSAAVGGMFPETNWRYWHDPNVPERVPGDVDLPPMVKRVRVWDLASSEGSGDFTVGTLLGKDAANNIYILDRQRVRRSPTGVHQLVLATAEADGYEVDILIEKERSGAGQTVIDSYQRDLPGFNVQAAKAEGDKESRATPYSILQGQNKVFLPRDAHWLNEWISEHAQMDGRGGRGRHDDQIDTAAYGVRHLLNNTNSILWDPSQIGTGDNLSAEDRVEMAVVRYALGLA